MEQGNDKLELVYGLEDKPSPMESAYAAMQHLLAIIVGIITPTLVIGGVLGLGERIPYLISMSLIVSGVATFIQAKRIGPIGSGLLSVQGTSFAFLGAILTAGFIVKGQGGGPDEILATIFGICFVGAFIEIVLSRFLHVLKGIITPVVTGTVVMLIGLSLVKVGITDMAGGKWLLDNKPQFFGTVGNLGLGVLVLLVVLILNRSKNPMIRMGSIVGGILVGYLVALTMGKVNFGHMSGVEMISIPFPFNYGFDFNWTAFVGVAFIYVFEETSENHIIVISGSNKEVKSNQISDKELSTSDVLISQLEVPTLEIEDLFARAKNSGAYRVLNTAPALKISKNLICETDLLVMNEPELENISERIIDKGNVDSIVQAINELNLTKAQSIVITLGSKGVFVYTNQKGQLIDGHEVEALDTTGSGDCFIGALASHFLQDKDLLDSADFANKAAALSVMKRGASASMPTMQEVVNFHQIT